MDTLYPASVYDGAPFRVQRDAAIHWIAALCVVIASAGSPVPASAHGSVVPEDDLCLIQIGYFKAHFKIFVPRERGHEEFCEDLPETGESVFVMEFMHNGLASAPIEFQIIHNVTGLGLFARLDDVEQIDDLESVTVFHRRSVIEPDVYSIVHVFDEPGEYIGIVSASYPETGKVYRAVFPFEVGFTGFGYWPLIVAVLLLVQLNYWFLSGHLSRWRRRWSNRPVTDS